MSSMANTDLMIKAKKVDACTVARETHSQDVADSF